MAEWMVFGLLLLLLGLLVYLMYRYRTVSQENRILKEILEKKDRTIANYEASRVAVQDVIDNYAYYEDVMKMTDSGMSPEDISETLGLSLNNIAIILKFDKIKQGL
jgi:hypothetical protein